MKACAKRVTVLKGGISSEREVSLCSGAAVGRALREAGWDVEEYDVRERGFALPRAGDPVFLCLHGTFGEDGELQERLEREGVFYTGCGPVACRLAFDKWLSKRRFVEHGVPTVPAALWEPGMALEPPCVLKPTRDGSSVGVHLVRTAGETEPAARAAAERGDAHIVEPLVEGREFTAGILGDLVLPLVEVRPREGFYDYANKYTAGRTEHLCPAPLEAAETARLQAAARMAYDALGCEVYARVDVIRAADGRLHVLEVNTLPGMTELSLLPEAARAAGIGFAELCGRIMKLSREVRG